MLNPGDEVSTADLVMVAAGEVCTPATAWLCVTVDTYVSTDSNVTKLASEGHTTLRRLHQAGHPGVLDALLLFAVSRTGEQRHRVLPYRVRAKRVHWLEHDGLAVVPEGATLGGRMADALVAAMTKASN
jgi:hypothetical protein